MMQNLRATQREIKYQRTKKGIFFVTCGYRFDEQRLQESLPAGHLQEDRRRCADVPEREKPRLRHNLPNAQYTSAVHAEVWSSAIGLQRSSLHLRWGSLCWQFQGKIVAWTLSLIKNTSKILRNIISFRHINFTGEKILGANAREREKSGFSKRTIGNRRSCGSSIKPRRNNWRAASLRNGIDDFSFFFSLFFTDYAREIRRAETYRAHVGPRGWILMRPARRPLPLWIPDRSRCVYIPRAEG